MSFVESDNVFLWYIFIFPINRRIPNKIIATFNKINQGLCSESKMRRVIKATRFNTMMNEGNMIKCILVSFCLIVHIRLNMVNLYFNVLSCLIVILIHRITAIIKTIFSVNDDIISLKWFQMQEYLCFYKFCFLLLTKGLILINYEDIIRSIKSTDY